MKIEYCVALGLIIMSGSAYAQTACPTGVAAGSIQCGPSPASHGVNPLSPAVPEIRYVPTGAWKETWGAIAGDDAGTNSIGVTVGKFSEADASREAIARCEEGGGVKCRLRPAYRHQCAVIADPRRTARPY